MDFSSAPLALGSGGGSLLGGSSTGAGGGGSREMADWNALYDAGAWPPFAFLTSFASYSVWLINVCTFTPVHAHQGVIVHVPRHHMRWLHDRCQVGDLPVTSLDASSMTATVRACTHAQMAYYYWGRGLKEYRTSISILYLVFMSLAAA